MTRKHFEAIARAVRNEWESTGPFTVEANGERTGIWRLVVAIANEMERENPRFDRDRFVRACVGEVTTN